MAEIADAGTSQFAPLYGDDMSLFEKIERVAKGIYYADEVLADQKIRDQLKLWEKQGYGHLPVCMAKPNTASPLIQPARCAHGSLHPRARGPLVGRCGLHRGGLR